MLAAGCCRCCATFVGCAALFLLLSFVTIDKLARPVQRTRAALHQRRPPWPCIVRSALAPQAQRLASLPATPSLLLLLLLPNMSPKELDDESLPPSDLNMSDKDPPPPPAPGMLPKREGAAADRPAPAPRSPPPWAAARRSSA